MADRGEGAWARRHGPAVGDDREKVGGGADEHHWKAAKANVCRDHEDDQRGRPDVDPPARVTETVAGEGREQDELGREGDDRQPTPTKPDLGERLEPTSEDQPDDDAREHGVEDEHRRSIVGARRHGRPC